MKGLIRTNKTVYDVPFLTQFIIFAFIQENIYKLKLEYLPAIMDIKIHLTQPILKEKLIPPITKAQILLFLITLLQCIKLQYLIQVTIMT